jgi:site-specific DNA-methyltransferase (adenine-specific)
MKPYYRDDWVTIYHGDCREVLPGLDTGSADLIITDPPYGLNYNNGDLAHCWEAAFGGDTSRSIAKPICNDGEAETDALIAWAFPEFNRLLSDGSCCCCCCGGGGPKPLFARWTLLLDEAIGFKQAVVWDKGGLGMGIHFRRSYEFMLIAQKGAPCRVWNGGNTTSNVWRINKIIPREQDHPTPKPPELMGYCVDLFSNPGDYVLDPFMGEGPTIQSAKLRGRHAIGIEIEERYCEIAAKRCAQEVLNLTNELPVDKG